MANNDRERPPLLPTGPLTLGHMVNAAVRHLFGSPAVTLGLAALLTTVSAAVNGIVIDGLLIGGSTDGLLARALRGAVTPAELPAVIDELRAAAPALLATYLVTLAVQLAGSGIFSITMDRAIRAQSPRPGEVWAAVPWRRLIAVSLLVAALVMAGLIVAVPLVLLGTTGALLALGTAAVYVLAMTVFTALAVPAAVLEGLAPVAAVRRSVQLVRGAFVRTAGLLVIANFFGQSFATFAALPFESLAAAATSAGGQALGSLLGSIAAGAVSLPFVTGMTVLVYVDRRRRTDAVDGDRTETL